MSDPYSGNDPSQQSTPPPPPPAYGYAQPPQYVAQPPNDGLGLAAMITGIAALALSCAYGVGLIASPVALVMGRISMKRIDASGGALGGRGMAQAGFILGIVGSVLLVLAIILVVVIVVIAVNGGFDASSSSTDF